MTDFYKKYTYQIILLTGFFIFFHHLSQPGFFLDGLIYAALGKNAAVKGAWLIPTLNEAYFKTFTDHIPFMLMLHGLFFKFFGVSFFSARLLVGLFSFGTFASIVYFAKKKVTNFQVIITAFLFLLIYPLLRHARHPNYDMPLMLCCFLAISFYIKAIEDNLKRDWYFVGISFGFAMLFKGPMAVFVPLTIFVHLIITKRLQHLLSFTPWLSLLLGFGIFSLWPLALFFTGQIDFFFIWFKFTFLNSILNSRGVETNDYFTYVRYLFTYAPIQIILAIFSFYKLFRAKWSEYYRVHLTFFLVVLVLTSAMKFKLSHYITCIYPSLVIIASMGIKEVVKEKIYIGFLSAMLLISAIVFIYPQDPKKNRDYEIFEIRRVLVEKKLFPKKYILETGAYPYWSLVSLIEFVDGLTTYQMPITSFQTENSQALFIVKKENKKEISLKCTFIYNLENNKAEAYYCP